MKVAYLIDCLYWFPFLSRQCPFHAPAAGRCTWWFYLVQKHRRTPSIQQSWDQDGV